MKPILYVFPDVAWTDVEKALASSRWSTINMEVVRVNKRGAYPSVVSTLVESYRSFDLVLAGPDQELRDELDARGVMPHYLRV